MLKIGDVAIGEMEGDRDEDEFGDVVVLIRIEFQEGSDGGGV